MRADEIRYILLDGGSEGDVATVEILVPGATIAIMGETNDVNGGLVPDGTHISISPPDARVLTRKNMRLIADRILKDAGYVFIDIRGAARSTGARPGHIPRNLRFP